MDVFTANGLQVLGQSHANPRNKDKIGFQKHLLAFTNADLNLGTEQLQILFTNSHDGTTGCRLDLGAFRFVCANGLVSGDVESSMSIRHTGSVIDKLDSAIKYQLDRLPKIAANISRFKGIELSDEQAWGFALDAAKLKDANAVQAYVRFRRLEDTSRDLWTFFNAVQESLIRGGLRYRTEEGEFKSTRKVSAVSTVMTLNKQIWNLADEFASKVA